MPQSLFLCFLEFILIMTIIRSMLSMLCMHTSRQVLAERYPSLASLVLDSNQITLALNEEYVTPEQESSNDGQQHGVVLSHGDTIAIIPPISGG